MGSHFPEPPKPSASSRIVFEDKASDCWVRVLDDPEQDLVFVQVCPTKRMVNGAPDWVLYPDSIPALRIAKALAMAAPPPGWSRKEHHDLLIKLKEKDEQIHQADLKDQRIREMIEKLAADHGITVDMRLGSYRLTSTNKKTQQIIAEKEAAERQRDSIAREVTDLHSEIDRLQSQVRKLQQSKQDDGKPAAVWWGTPYRQSSEDSDR